MWGEAGTGTARPGARRCPGVHRAGRCHGGGGGRGWPRCHEGITGGLLARPHPPVLSRAHLVAGSWTRSCRVSCGTAPTPIPLAVPGDPRPPPSPSRSRWGVPAPRPPTVPGLGFGDPPEPGFPLTAPLWGTRPAPPNNVWFGVWGPSGAPLPHTALCGGLLSPLSGLGFGDPPEPRFPLTAPLWGIPKPLTLFAAPAHPSGCPGRGSRLLGPLLRPAHP